MAKITSSLILTGVFALIGVLLLISSSLYLDNVRGLAEACRNCAGPNFMVAASSLGIIAAVIQVSFCCMEIFNPDFGAVRKYWIVVLIAMFVLTIVAFSISMHYTMDTNRSTYIFFNSMTGIDWIFCVVAFVVDKYILKNNH